VLKYRTGDGNAKQASYQLALLFFSLESAVCLRRSEETPNFKHGHRARGGCNLTFV